MSPLLTNKFQQYGKYKIIMYQ